MNDRRKTPAELHREKTYAERQARVREQAKRDEEATVKARAMRQAHKEAIAEVLSQAKANQAQAKADFDALGELMAETTDRTELLRLGRERANLAPYTGNSYVYMNHCWRDHTPISSEIDARCPYCRWYICSTCGSCSPDCDKTDHSFLPDLPDDLP